MSEINKLEAAFKDLGIEEKEVQAEIIPERCIACRNHTICNPLLTFLTLYDIGIKLQVDSCTFYRSTVD